MEDENERSQGGKKVTGKDGREKTKWIFIFISLSFCWHPTAELIVNSEIFFVYLLKLKDFSEYTMQYIIWTVTYFGCFGSVLQHLDMI